jgi:hypothetical protein
LLLYLFFASHCFYRVNIDGRVSLTRETIIDIIVVSNIAGTAGVGSWLFAKIDERKARKSPPSDPE